MATVECLIDDCNAAPDRELTVDSDGLLLVFAVCSGHLVAIKNGAMVPETKQPNRGLLGMRAV